MEKAIIKTLIYADLFDFPMKAWEIQKWLVNKKGGLREVEISLNKLRQKAKVKSQKEYYFLGDRKGLVTQRIKKEEVSKRYLKQAYFIAQLFKIIPWIKLVGISGSVAMENAKESDDIDFFVIVSKGRLWISRILLLLLLELTDKRRKRGEELKKVKGKICINLIVDEESLGFWKKDIYVAHEVLQMRVLWQRGDVYSKFLEKNEWVFKFLPNWTSSFNSRGPVRISRSLNTLMLANQTRFAQTEIGLRVRASSRPAGAFDLLENFAKWIQLRYMGKPEGKERIENGALFFHPQDYREKVLKRFKERLANFS